MTGGDPLAVISANRVHVPPFLLRDRGDVDSHISLLLRCMVLNDANIFEFPSRSKTKPWKTQDNVRAFLNHFGVAIRYDEFARAYTCSGVPHRHMLDDDAFGDIYAAIDAFGLQLPKEYLWTILKAIGREKKHNPLLEYIDGLKWDRTPRLDDLLIRHFDAADNDYVRAVTAAWHIGAIRRLRSPGCQMDYVLLLDGPEGLLKSTFFRIMGYDVYFTDNLPIGVDGKGVIEQTYGKWIVEFAELAALNKRENEETKAFITRRQDEGRRCYDRERSEHPRQFVLGGTSNKAKPFKDTDGNRRWWMVVCRKRMDTKTLVAERDQIWAEAAFREAAGEPNWLTPEIEAEARKLQAEALRIGPMQEHLEEALSDFDNCFVSSRDLYRALGLEVNRRTNQHSDMIESAMKRLGFIDTRARIGSGDEKKQVRGYQRGKLINVLVPDGYRFELVKSELWTKAS